MKKQILSFFLVLIAVQIQTQVHAQIKKPVKWKTPYLSEKNPAVGSTVELIFKANVDSNWYLYSSDFEEGGPNVTKFDFEGSSGIKVLGDVVAVNSKKEYDDVYNMDYRYFEPHAEFRQKVLITAANPLVNVRVDFQTCYHSGSCIFDKEKFAMDIKTSTPKPKIVSRPTPVIKKVSKPSYKEVAKREVSVEKPGVNQNKRSFYNTKDDKLNEELFNSGSSEDIVNYNKHNAYKSMDHKLISKEGNMGKGKDGLMYVFVNNKWHKVPKGNSPEFHKKYLLMLKK